MKIEFKNVATVADIKKAFEKAEIPDEAKIVVQYFTILKMRLFYIAFLIFTNF